MEFRKVIVIDSEKPAVHTDTKNSALIGYYTSSSGNVVISYRCFGAAYRFHIQESRRGQEDFDP